MDLQTAFNIAAGVISIAGGLAGWHLKGVNDRIKDLEREDQALHAAIAIIRELLPTAYVRRDDFKDLGDNIFEALRRIETKLDGKADKP